MLRDQKAAQFITDESMWGGSEYGPGSVRSGKSGRYAVLNMLSKIKFVNLCSW